MEDSYIAQLRRKTGVALEVVLYTFEKYNLNASSSKLFKRFPEILKPL